MVKPVEVKALNKYQIWLKYEDGTEGNVDISHLAGKGVFKNWDTDDLFENIYIDKETHAIAWNEIIDICPDTLYLKIKGFTFEDWKSKCISSASN